MALSKSITVNAYGQSITFDSAYYQIDSINGNKDTLNLIIFVYSDSSKTNLVTQNTYSFTPSIADQATNFYKQGYDYLKTLPDFQGATDVPETGQSV
jgi:hypothetical protein